MPGKLYCSICKTEIIKDRCNVDFVIERQDFPFETDWQSSSDFNKPDICFKCYTGLLDVLRIKLISLMGG
jgi:hypothetical protein